MKVVAQFAVAALWLLPALVLILSCFWWLVTGYFPVPMDGGRVFLTGLWTFIGAFVFVPVMAAIEG